MKLQEINYTATDGARAVIDRIARTEDIRLSPDRRRLAIAGFARNQIALLDIDIRGVGASSTIALNSGQIISSDNLKRPHGIDFIGNRHLAVANREGDLVVFELPPTGNGNADLLPVFVRPSRKAPKLGLPGSVRVITSGPDSAKLLVCNNATNKVTEHELALNDRITLTGERELLNRWVELPDGLALSPDHRWLAISNHDAHNIAIFDLAATPLNADAPPVAILRQIHYPHGLHFSADGKRLFAADAGTPYIRSFHCPDGTWHGVFNPECNLRSMDDETFLKGNTNPEEGGPKGIELDRQSGLLIVTSEHQPLSFFDSSLINGANEPAPATDLDYELRVMATQKAKVDHLTSSSSWRLTAPLRSATTAWRRFRKSQR